MDLSSLRYTKSHEWARLEGDICTVGITQFAVEQLTDVTNVDLPTVNRMMVAGKPFGEIESVKAVFDLNSPIDGQVVEVNAALKENLSLITNDSYGYGWMIRVQMAPGSTLDHLLTLEEYKTQLASDGH